MLKNLLARLVSAPQSASAPRDTAERLIAEGNQAESRGDLALAGEIYRQAVAADPGYPKACLNLGIGLEATGDAIGAAAAYRQALAIDPGEPFSCYNLGKLLFTQGALDESLALLRRALERKPDFPEAHVVLASVSEAMGNLPGAVAELEAVLRLQPRYFGALRNYAAILQRLDRLPEAEQALRCAREIEPQHPEVNFELGNMLRARRQPAEAERFLRQAAQSMPDSADAHMALAEVCEAQGKLADAAGELETVLRARPDWVDALYNYGVALDKLHRAVAAENVFRRALALDPGHFFSHRMLGRVLFNQARLAEALQVHAEARARFPAELELASAELFLLNFSEDITDAALFERHKALAAQYEQAHPVRFAPHANSPDPARRLRVGYVSGELARHPVAQFLAPLVERHDRDGFEVYCYANGEIDSAIAAGAEVRRVAGVGHDALADMIHRDRIDILIDLAGHSGVPHLRVFAQRPAPVQVSWLGYLSTTGMTRMQYRLTDAVADPPGQNEARHTETLVRLPGSQWCYRPESLDAIASELPLLRNGYVTFGSFNQMSKLSPAICDLWAKILAAAPAARLRVLGFTDPAARERLLHRFASAGIAADRLVIETHLPPADYLRAFNDVDIALDTTPYSGGTTTFDALWMGVPVLTVRGTRPMARSAASILTSVGLTEWIAATPRDYVRLALEYAGDAPALTRLRGSLRARLQASALMDEARFARNVEAAYRRMWAQWCDLPNRCWPD